MNKPELTLKVNSQEATNELIRLNELLKEADRLIDSISDKLNNLTATINIHH